LKCAIAEADRDASEYWKNYFEKTVAELRSSKERCFEKSVECVKKIKTSFANVGTCGGQISPGSTGRVKDLTKGPRAQ
jgi:hypothetical protein